MSEPHTIARVRVRYSEVDRMGFAYHAHYLAWCEIGRTELIREHLGVSYEALESRGILLAVSDASVRYHRAARYDDEVRVETWVEEVRSRTVTFRYTISRGEGERLATARTALVSLDAEGRTRRLPQEVAETLGRLAGGGR